MKTVFRVFAMVLFSLGSVQALARQPIFLSLYAGGESHDASYQYKEPLNLNLDDDGDTLGFGAGYEVTEHWIVQVDYTYTDGGDKDIEQILLSLNYKFPVLIKGMSAVVGVLAGEGRLELQNAPEFGDNFQDDTGADQSSLGFQVGLSYDLTDSWSTNLTYQYLDQEFKTHLNTTNEIGGRINFFDKQMQYVLFGMRYHF